MWVKTLIGDSGDAEVGCKYGYNWALGALNLQVGAIRMNEHIFSKTPATQKAGPAP